VKKKKKKDNASAELDGLFPASLTDLLTAGGAEFLERVGPDVVRRSVLQVLLGHNVRTQTEPLTRQRIAEVGGGVLAMFEKGHRLNPDFFRRLSSLAASRVQRGGTRENAWPAQWALGLTGKGIQNVLRSDIGALDAFCETLDRAISLAAVSLTEKIGPLSMALRIGIDPVNDSPTLGWADVLRILTAIGCAELTIRGSDKSRYGKLFERLVLGSVLTLLGFHLDNRRAGSRNSRVFWLSDSTDERECDATAIIRPGIIARFDIGFIGIGNPEIVRDKLSRFARSIEAIGHTDASTTFIVVDRIPTGAGANTLRIAEKSGTSVTQMSMTLWPRELAKELSEKVGHVHQLCNLDDTATQTYIEQHVSSIDVRVFLRSANARE